MRRSQANDAQDRFFHRLNVEMRGIDVLRVGGLQQGRLRPGAVTLIPNPDFASNLTGIGLLALEGKLLMPAPGPHFGRGVEEDLHPGVGEDDGADIAALHDEIVGFGESLLLGDHFAADARDGGNAGGGIGDGLIANGLGDVFAVQQDLSGLLQLDVGGQGKLLQAMPVIQAGANAQCPQSDGPVHGACVDVQVTQAAGDTASDGAFARTGRAVNRHHHRLAQHRAPATAEVAGRIFR